MIARLMHLAGRPRFVWFVTAKCIHGYEACPVEEHQRAWRRSIYRPPHSPKQLSGVMALAALLPSVNNTTVSDAESI